MEALGFNVDKNADYVFIAGCAYPELTSHVFKSIKEFLNIYKVDYALLSKEHWCGYPVCSSAVISKDEATIGEEKMLLQIIMEASHSK